MSTATHRPDAVTAFACRVARLLNEVVAGARPGRQVVSLFGVHLRGMLCRARPQPGAVARVRRLIITSHRKDVYEVVAICTRAGRVVALGLQLTRAGDRWQVTDLAHPQLRAAGCLDRYGGRACERQRDEHAVRRTCPSCPTCRVTRESNDDTRS